MSTAVPTTLLPSGEAVPILGQGTWRMGEDPLKRNREVEALQKGLELGMTLIDTAEMYGEGGAERVVADAITGRRDEVFLVSKFYPHNATQKKMIAACERSLKRLNTDRIDLYLLHWREDTPLEETLRGFDTLLESGKIRYWGVSNFDLSDMLELWSIPTGRLVATNQVLYNLTRRGIEYDLLPWSRQKRIPLMAYSPIEQGQLLNHSALLDVALRYDATPAQIALAWLLNQRDIITIPKSSTPEHLLENRHALDIHLTPDDLTELDQAFPPPKSHAPLETI